MRPIFCCGCTSKRRILSSYCTTLNPTLVHAVKSRCGGSKTCFLTPTKRQIIVTLTSSDLTYQSSREPPTDKKTVETAKGYREQGVNLMVIDQEWKVTRGGRRSIPHLWMNKFGLRPCYNTRISFCSGDKHPAVWMWKLLELVTE